MINAGILDANIFLRLVGNEHSQQRLQVERLIQRIANGEVNATILPSTIHEMVYVMSGQYREDRQSVFGRITTLFRLRGLEIIDRNQILDALILFRDRANISFADAYHCAMARSFHNGAIVSFDQKLSGIEGVTRREPGDFVTA